MDIKVVGAYLAELRKENNLTQEQLGEKLGVTNKTISRWETGTYLPPVDILEKLSDMYGITINEIISGRELTDIEYKKEAEKNIKSVLNRSTFTLQEKIEFFKKKSQTVMDNTEIINCYMQFIYSTLEYYNDVLKKDLIDRIGKLDFDLDDYRKLHPDFPTES